MRVLALLLLGGLALAASLDEARALYARGEMEGALARLKPLLSGYDPPEEALLLAGFAHYRLGQLEEALYAFARLVGTLKGGPEALYGFGLALRALEDLEGARSALEEALRRGYGDAEPVLRTLPPPSPPAPKARKAPPPFRAEKGRFWVEGKPFQVRGVNLGVALPGRFPAEFPEEVWLYRAWLELLSAMGANAVRVYTLLPPAFYRALLGHNLTHPKSPLYLFQGVWTELPEEEGYGDWEGAFLEKFLLEGREVLDALHGNLRRPPKPGHAHGDYTADVSPWTLGLLVGREFEPYSVAAYNERHPGRAYRGRFLEALPGASPFEAYIAEVLDRLAQYEWEAYGTARPLSVSNWPTLDPLYHPTESTREEEAALRRARGEQVPEEVVKEYNNDQVSLDMAKIQPIPGSPFTTFANYHAYPYYPDFMNLDPTYGKAVGPFGPSNYFGYLHPSCYLPPGPEKIVAAMLSLIIAAFCIIDDALQAMGYKDDPQAKTPASAILTLAILAAMELGGKHNKALALAKDLNLFTYIPSPSRFNRRLHALYPLFLPLLHLLSQVWKNLHQAQAYALDTFPLPACENIRAPRSRLFPHKVYRGFVPSKRVYIRNPSGTFPQVKAHV
jgi:tetratricopeptide (TPR) repeat protein